MTLQTPQGSGHIVRVQLPVLYCRDCRSQVCLTDADGRRTMPTFRLIGTDDLLCVFCARKQSEPLAVAPLFADEATWVDGCSPAMTEAETFDFLIRLGAEVLDD